MAALPLYQMLSGLGDTLGGAMREYGQRQSLSEIGRLYQAGDMKGAAAKLFEMGDVNTGVQLLTAAQQREDDDKLLAAAGLSGPVSGGVTSQGPAPSGAAGAGAPMQLSGGAVAEEFRKLGYTPTAIAGILGNFKTESGMRPDVLGDKGTSGGLGQWHNERFAGLKQFAAERGADWRDPRVQVAYTDHELHTSEKPVLQRLQSARTPEEAALAFTGFERPQGWSPNNPGGAMYMDRRLQAARQFGAGGQPVQVADASGGVPASAGGGGVDVDALNRRIDTLTGFLARAKSPAARAALSAQIDRAKEEISRADRQTELQFRRQDRQDNLEFRRQEAEYRRQQIEETRRQNDPSYAYEKRLEAGKKAGLHGEELTAYALSGKAPTTAGDKPPNIDQANAAGFADRMRNAESLFTDEKGQPTAVIGALTGAQAGANRLSGMIPLVGNALQSEDYQRAYRAKEDFISAVLRKESGAAISDGEFAREDRKYFPQPGDKPSVLADKAKARQIAIQSMERSAGPALKRAVQPQQASSGIGALLQKLPPERLAKAQKALELGASEAEILQALGVK